MTDKQIIEKLKTDLDFERSKRKTLQAELKAKEQECERLKHDNGYEVGALEKTIENIKAENERLEVHSATLDAVIETGRVQYKALKQTLTEIKEIAEKQCVCGVDCIDMKQILQKISECEGK